MNSNSKGIMPAPTGFRAIAAWMIFVLHFFPFNNLAYLIQKGFIPILIYDYIAENVAAFFIITTALSVLMFRYMEEPLNRFIRKRYAK